MPYRIDPKTKTVVFEKPKAPAVTTVTIRDRSDGQGLKVGQDVRVSGHRDKIYRVVRVHPPARDGSRSYDLTPSPNRDVRRAIAKVKGKKK